MLGIFAPGSTFAENNAAAATTAVVLPASADTLYIANTSTTAIAYYRITNYTGPNAPTGDAPTATNSQAVLPNSFIYAWVGPGAKVFRAIASAADGKLQVTAGNMR